MELTKTELNILSQLARSNEKTADIAIALDKSKSQIYRNIGSLESKGFIERDGTKIWPKKEVHVSLLLRDIKNNPALINLLSDSGLKILETLIEPKKVLEIVHETKLSKIIIYRKIKKARNMSLIRKKNGMFEINSIIWPELKDFLTSLLKYEGTVDKRIPAEAIIYLKNEKDLIFSSINEQNATLTAFSVFEDYKIKILTPEAFYYLPIKKLSIREVFQHSLIIAEKRKEFRYFLYTALFYLQFKNKLKNIQHPVLNSINSILQGKEIKGYPPLSEIKEKAEQYDIKI